MIDVKALLRAQYGENKRITDGNYDKSLAVKCINGTFIGKMTENIISYRGIPFVGKHPVGELRWKVHVDVIPDDGVSLEPFEAYANGAAKDIDFIQGCNKNEMNFFVYNFDFDDRKAKMFPKLTDAEKKLVESFWNDMTGVESWERDSRLLSQIWFNAPIIKLAASLTPITSRPKPICR